MFVALRYKILSIFIGFYALLVGILYLFPLNAATIELMIGHDAYSWFYQSGLTHMAGGGSHIYVHLLHWIHIPILLFLTSLSMIIAETQNHEASSFKIISEKIGVSIASLAVAVAVSYLLITTLFGSGPYGWAGLAIGIWGLVAAGVLFLIIRAVLGSWYLDESLSERWSYSIFECIIWLSIIWVLL